MRRDVYVYYRIDPARRTETARAVDAQFSALAALCTAPPRRQQRCDDATTWMETYTGIQDYPAFSKAMQVAAGSLSGLIVSERHLECFIESGES